MTSKKCWVVSYRAKRSGAGSSKGDDSLPEERNDDIFSRSMENSGCSTNPFTGVYPSSVYPPRELLAAFNQRLASWSGYLASGARPFVPPPLQYSLTANLLFNPTAFSNMIAEAKKKEAKCTVGRSEESRESLVESSDDYQVPYEQGLIKFKGKMEKNQQHRDSLSSQSEHSNRNFEETCKSEDSFSQSAKDEPKVNFNGSDINQLDDEEKDDKSKVKLPVSQAGDEEDDEKRKVNIPVKSNENTARSGFGFLKHPLDGLSQLANLASEQLRHLHDDSSLASRSDDSPSDVVSLLKRSSFVCRFCSAVFASPVDHHQHERYLCSTLSNPPSVQKKRARDEVDDCNLRVSCGNNLRAGKQQSIQLQDNRNKSFSESTTSPLKMKGKESVGSSRRKSVFSEEKLIALRDLFAIDQSPSRHDIACLAVSIGCSTRAVQVWFQNMRARERRQQQHQQREQQLLTGTMTATTATQHPLSSAVSPRPLEVYIPSVPIVHQLQQQLKSSSKQRQLSRKIGNKPQQSTATSVSKIYGNAPFTDLSAHISPYSSSPIKSPQDDLSSRNINGDCEPLDLSMSKIRPPFTSSTLLESSYPSPTNSSTSCTGEEVLNLSTKPCSAADESIGCHVDKFTSINTMPTLQFPSPAASNSSSGSTGISRFEYGNVDAITSSPPLAHQAPTILNNKGMPTAQNNVIDEEEEEEALSPWRPSSLESAAASYDGSVSPSPQSSGEKLSPIKHNRSPSRLHNWQKVNLHL